MTKRPDRPEISARLQSHEDWLASKGRAGKPLRLAGSDLHQQDLARSNLQRAILQSCNFEHAVLEGCQLQEADLTGSNLRGSLLKGAQLQGARVKNVILRDADLTDADLEDANGLLAAQLAGANLAGARLPASVAKFEGLALLSERSRNAKSLLLSLLLGCIYTLLTVGTTTDGRLLSNSASSPLPIIQTPIPIVWFYWIAPFILVGIHLYCLLYLQRMWECLTELPAVFPDGQAVDQKAYPWLLNGLVRAYFAQLRSEHVPFTGLQTWISILLCFWAVPPTLLFVWGRYLVRHDWFGTTIHFVLLFVSIGASIIFHQLAAKTLRGEGLAQGRPKQIVSTPDLTVAATVTLAILGVFVLLSYGGIDGARPLDDPVDPHNQGRGFKSEYLSPKRWAPLFFSKFGYLPFATLDEQDISTKPANWTGQTDSKTENAELSLVKPAHLQGVNLRYASAVGVFLAKADLRGADLTSAILIRADLRQINPTVDDLADTGTVLKGAILSMADLRGAHLRGADLSGARLLKANLAGAELGGADLRDAVLVQANLTKATLHGADLARARLGGADVTETDFTGVKNLSAHQIRTCRNWQSAKYGKTILEQLGSPPPFPKGATASPPRTEAR